MPSAGQQRQHGASSPATIPTSGTFRRPYPPVEPSNFQRYLKYLAFEIFRFSKVCAGRKNKETYVPRAPGETVPSSSYIWVTWVTFPRRATVKMNRNSRIAIRRRAVRCYSSAAGGGTGRALQKPEEQERKEAELPPLKKTTQNEIKKQAYQMHFRLETTPFFRTTPCLTGDCPAKTKRRFERNPAALLLACSAALLLPASAEEEREKKKNTKKKHAIMCR